jgi:hypothetical protein
LATRKSNAILRHMIKCVVCLVMCLEKSLLSKTRFWFRATGNLAGSLFF